MKTSAFIGITIDRLPKGYVFTYDDFLVNVDRKEAVIKALNRMAASGKIVKLTKGRYYKPEATAFGNLMPNQSQVVKDLLEQDGKLVGYLTGFSIFNEFGLTTQVSNTIQIGKNSLRPAFKRERYSIIFLRQKNVIRKENIGLLQLLDCICLVKKIPDTPIEDSCQRLKSLLKKLTDEQLTTLVRLAAKYNPATRALLGAMLSDLKKADAAAPLYRSLNPITKYKISGVSKALPSAAKWNIV